MKNTADLARCWTEFVAARPEFSSGDLLLRQFAVGRISRLCDCGCNSYDIEIPLGTSLSPLVPPSERGGTVFELEFQTQEWGKTLGFFLFVNADGYLSGLDVDYCGNSFPMPEKPCLVEPPFHVRGLLVCETRAEQT